MIWELWQQLWWMLRRIPKGRRTPTAKLGANVPTFLQQEFSFARSRQRLRLSSREFCNFWILCFLIGSFDSQRSLTFWILFSINRRKVLIVKIMNMICHFLSKTNRFFRKNQELNFDKFKNKTTKLAKRQWYYNISPKQKLRKPKPSLGWQISQISINF